MHIRKLILQPFRNFSHTELKLRGEGGIIVAPNASGKSNILEAISFLSIGKSVRGIRDREAVPHGGKHFEIRAILHDGQREHELRLCYVHGKGKQAFLDGAALGRISDLLSMFPTVHFCPEDVALILRFTAQRRRLLDILISQADGEYLHNLQRFQRIIAQRNQCLKSSKSIIDLTRDLEPWNSQVSKIGGLIRRKRIEVLVEFQPLLASFYERFSTAREKLSVTYCGTSPVDLHERRIPTETELAVELGEDLVRANKKELQSGYTQCGPHRDIISFALDGEPADRFASQGQHKSILISWKMSELRFLETESGQQPTLLLDDAFSELDADRSRELMELAMSFEKVVMTAPQSLPGTPHSRFTEMTLPNGG